jgi:hypothetical protein
MGADDAADQRLTFMRFARGNGLWMVMFFRDAFIPVIPLPQTPFETFGKNLKKP